jgi:hypothetical protein
MGSTPQGGTPIKRALEGQIPLLSNLLPPSPLPKDGKRVLIVMTDGVPDGPSDIQPQVQQQCVDLVQNANTGAANVTTFAIGVGNPSSPDTTYNEMFVGRLAMAGGAAPAGCMVGWNETAPSSATPCHFQVTPGQKTAAQIRDELKNAIDAIRGEVQGCDFEIKKTDGSSGVPDPTRVNVAIKDGVGKRQHINKDDQNGWSFDNPANPTRVTLHGAACEKVKKSTSGVVEIELGCTTRVN